MSSASGRRRSSRDEASHYVVTAHPPGSVLQTAQCNFLAPDSQDIIIAKSRRLEIRQPAPDDTSSSSSPLPMILSVPIHGRIVCLQPIVLPQSPTAYLFLLTEHPWSYAVISYQPNQTPYPFQTHASGTLLADLSTTRKAECGPLVALEVHQRCLALHLYDGLVTILPIHRNYVPPVGASRRKGGSHHAAAPSTASPHELMGDAFYVRLEERLVLACAFLDTDTPTMPLLSLLHQDAHGRQHVSTHMLDVKHKQWHAAVESSNAGGSSSSNVSGMLLKKSRVDGGSCWLVALPRQAPRVAAAGGGGTAPSTAATTPGTGGLLIVGQRQITWLQSNHVVKVVPLPACIIMSITQLPPDDTIGTTACRFLMGDEYGNVHLLTVDRTGGTMGLDTLGNLEICSSALEYFRSRDNQQQYIFVGSQMADSALVQLHPEPVPQEPSGAMDDKDDMLHANTTHLSIVEEYTNLGSIVDFDLVPTQDGQNQNHNEQDGTSTTTIPQSQVITASGTSMSGTLRLIRNGIGMQEYACVEMGGIQNMWSVRSNYQDSQDAYLVQSFVGETRVLGVTPSSSSSNSSNTAMQEDMKEIEEEEDVGGTLEEVFWPGLQAHSSTLYVGNVQVGNVVVQITEKEIRLLEAATLQCTTTWSPEEEQLIIVASANEAGQIVVALRGGLLLHFCVRDDCTLELVHKVKMEKEVSCLDLNPFTSSEEQQRRQNRDATDAMDVEERTASRSALVAVGLWDDFSVRLLSLESNLEEVLHINLSEDEDDSSSDADARPDRRNRNNMMARSLCLVTLDSASSPASRHSAAAAVNMLFVGLGDGTLISFAVLTQDEALTVQSKKEVSLGTQRISLVPLTTERGGTCLMATGDRPTVIYLAGGGGASATNFSNPKLCYSNVNLSATDEETDDNMSRPPAQQSIAVNVATPFSSPVLFDTSSLGSKHHSLCIADESNLRLGVIDDIQKLHVTTCRLGMTPRRVVHSPEGRLFAVACADNGAQRGGSGNEDVMGDCVRFLDDTTFDDIDRIDLEPHEMVLSMAHVAMGTACTSSTDADKSGTEVEAVDGPGVFKPYLLIGTAYTFPDEDEPTRGRILVYSCSNDGPSPEGASRGPRHVTELQVRGGVYSICQFYDGKVLASVNSKTQVCHLTEDAFGVTKFAFVGIGHHGHILSMFVRSKAGKSFASNARSSGEMDAIMTDDLAPTERSPPTMDKEQLAIVGDLMRSISLVRYYPEHVALEEIARDFNANFTTAVEMLTDDIYLGAESWQNLFVLRRNVRAQSEEVRCRLDTVGEFHLGEQPNKFMTGSLVMPHTNNSSSSSDGGGSRRRKVASLRTTSSPIKSRRDGKRAATAATTTSRIRRPSVTVGSRTLFGTVDGTLGCILGLDARTAAFFDTLQRAMAKTISPVGDLSHARFRKFDGDGRSHPYHGFVDGDLVETFLDLDRSTMEAVVQEMNRDGGWDMDSNVSAEKDGDDEDAQMGSDSTLAVEDVLAMVEEMAMFH